MFDLLRDAPLGQIIRYATGNRVLLYPEERPNFELPKSYNGSTPTDSENVSGSTTPRPRIDSDENNLERQVTLNEQMPERIASIPVAITPSRLKDGTILVDWYTTDDAENAQSWTPSKKAFVALQIW
jgi:DHA1 family multidrug resistance protein-like MFS transporter